MSAQGTRPLARLLLLSALFGALAVTAAPASASSPLQSTKASVSTAERLPYPLGFTIEASNGYSAFVFGVPARKSHPSTIAIFVTGKSNGAFYSAPATVTERTIQAPLGALGEIAVTFHPSGRARAAHPACDGKPVSFDSGYYEGTINFYGEEDFTEVEAIRAPGDIGFLINVLCPGISGETSGPSVPGAKLNISAQSSRLGAHMRVIKNRPKTRAYYNVSLSERSSGILIERFANLIAPASTFTYDPKVKTATLRPPVPFSGSAQFHRNAKPANRWTGNLIVDLPGRAGVRLTGEGLKAKLAHAHWDWHTSPE